MIQKGKLKAGRSDDQHHSRELFLLPQVMLCIYVELLVDKKQYVLDRPITLFHRYISPY